MKQLLLVPVLLFLSNFGYTNAQQLVGWAWHKPLDENYNLTTIVNLTAESIQFNLNLVSDTSDANMWLGIGLSPEAGIVNGSDFVIAWSNETDGWMDYYALTKDELIEDEDTSGTQNEDWNVLDFNSSDNETFCSFTRMFKAKNATEDREIKDEYTYLIWAYGPMDLPIYSENTTIKGSYRLNIIRSVMDSSASVNSMTFGLIVMLPALIKTFVNL